MARKLSICWYKKCGKKATQHCGKNAISTDSFFNREKITINHHNRWMRRADALGVKTVIIKVKGARTTHARLLAGWLTGEQVAQEIQSRRPGVCGWARYSGWIWWTACTPPTAGAGLTANKLWPM